MTTTKISNWCDSCNIEFGDNTTIWKFSIKLELELSHARYMTDFYICSSCRANILRSLKRPHIISEDKE